MRLRIALLALLALDTLLAMPAVLRAQLAPIGSEVAISADPQIYMQFPHVARDAESGFVVSWYRWQDPWPGVTAMVGRRIGPDAQPAGAEFQISEGTVQSYSGLLESGPTGEFVLAWGQGFSGPGAGDPDDIHARRFTAEGTPLGPEFQVNTTPGNEYTGLTGLAMRAGGDFVVAWSNDYYGSFIRHYDADGTPLSDETLLSLPGDSVGDVRLVADSSGDLFAAWNRANGPLGAKFQVDGTPLGPSFPIASFPDGNQYVGDLAVLEDGSVVVSWTSSESPGDDDSGYSIQARRFDAAGNPLGDQFQVNTFVEGNQFSSRLAADASGGFVVVWSSYDSGGGDDSETSVQIRRFAPDGTPLGRELQVNRTTDGYQIYPQVATDPSGIVAVTWTGAGYLVQARTYRLSLFSDDFEFGDTSRWSATQP